MPEMAGEVPGPRSRRLAGELREVESRNVTHVAEGWPVFWERAAGCNVWDVDGNRYVDLTGAFAVASLGHGRRELVEAMRVQSERLLHGMGDVHPSAVKVECCRALGEVTFGRWGAGGSRTVLSSSGFEAVETAMKTAMLATGRPGVAAFEGGCHGLGYGALAPTARGKFRDPFREQLPAMVERWPFPVTAEELGDLAERLEGTDGGRIGAVLVEPVQGRGGVVAPPEGFLGLLRSWCDGRGALLVCDEIFTGFHRTGDMFACEREGIVPDLICLGKAMSGGFPISACVGREDVMKAWPESDGEALHTSTFLGHPVGCAMVVAAIRLHLDPETGEAVRRVAAAMERALAGLEDLAGVRDVRGRGAMWGVEMEGGARAQQVVGGMLRGGYLLLAGGEAGEVLSLTPPFVITDEEVGAFGESLRRVVREVEGYE